MFNRKVQRQKRHLRLRQRIVGTAARPRMSICVTNKNMYVQFIDDDAQKTLAQSEHAQGGEGQRRGGEGPRREGGGSRQGGRRLDRRRGPRRPQVHGPRRGHRQALVAGGVAISAKKEEE